MNALEGIDRKTLVLIATTIERVASRMLRDGTFRYQAWNDSRKPSKAKIRRGFRRVVLEARFGNIPLTVGGIEKNRVVKKNNKPRRALLGKGRTES